MKVVLFSFYFLRLYQRAVGLFGYQWINHGHSREGQPPFTGNPNLSDSSFFFLSRLCSADTEQMRWYIIVAENGRFNIYQNYITEKYSFFLLSFQANGARLCFMLRQKRVSQNMAANTSSMGEKSQSHAIPGCHAKIGKGHLHARIGYPRYDLTAPLCTIHLSQDMLLYCLHQHRQHTHKRRQCTWVKSIFHSVVEQRGETAF